MRLIPRNSPRRSLRPNRQRPGRALTVQRLERRDLLAITELPPLLPINYLERQVPIGIASDSVGSVIVSHDSVSGQVVQRFHPITSQAVTPSTTFNAGTFTAGKLATLTAEMIDEFPNLNFLADDLISLLPNGQLWHLRPGVGAVMIFDLRQLVSASRNPLAYHIENRDIFDTYHGIYTAFGGTVIPEQASYDQGDIDIYAGDDFTDIFVSGQAGPKPFVMRLRWQDGFFAGGKVLVSSDGQTEGSVLPKGVAVNDQGVVVTTLPVRDIFPDADFAVNAPVAFDATFPEGEGREPFRPFELLTNPPTVETSGRLTAAGITTDSYGNFVLASSLEGNLANTRSGVFLITNNLSDLVFQPFTSSSLLLEQRDVAVTPDNQWIFLTTNLAGDGLAQQQVLRLPFPLLPDLTEFTPDGWDDSLVVSIEPGSFSDSPTITTDDSVLVDLALTNRPHSRAGITLNPFVVALYRNDELVDLAVIDSGMAPGATFTVDDYDLGRLSAGEHTLTVVIDSLANQPEINERNNVFSKTFTVTEAPQYVDLTPWTPDGWDDPLVISTVADTHTSAAEITSAQILYVDWAHRNIGNAAAGQRFDTRLVLNGEPLSPHWYNEPPFEAGSIGAVHDFQLGPLSPGMHTLRLEVDFLDDVAESDEANNAFETTFEVVAGAQVIGAHLFYNASWFDGGTAGADSSDDQAIAINLAPLAPGETAGSSNLTSYQHGINGLMIDLAGASDADSITAADFLFRTGTTDDTSTWQPLLSGSQLSIRAGAGANGADRLTFIWPNGTITNTWLEVTVLANANTGLAEDAVFYFGSQIGDVTGDGVTNASDFAAVRLQPPTFLDPAAVDNLFDLNRDGRVNIVDLLMVREHATTMQDGLPMITPQRTGLRLTSGAQLAAGVGPMPIAARPIDEKLSKRADGPAGQSFEPAMAPRQSANRRAHLQEFATIPLAGGRKSYAPPNRASGAWSDFDELTEGDAGDIEADFR